VALPLLSPDAFVGRIEGQAVGLYRLQSTHLQAAFCNHGARLLELIVPDRLGQPRDVVLGHDSLQQLLLGMPSMGAFIGRYANRIAKSRFELGGREYRVPANEGPHCLHGGPAGTRHRVFQVGMHAQDRLQLHGRLRSADDGFPGDVDVVLEYRLEGARLILGYEATVTGAATPLSLTAHPFFNLEGHDADSALDHELQIVSDEFVPVDPARIPRGYFASVQDTAFDFRRPRSLRQALAQGHVQLEIGSVPGFDHAYRTRGPAGALHVQARLRAPGSGIVLELWADTPSLQFYSGAAMDGQLPRHAGKHGRVYRSGAALCLEPQQFPDAPNQPLFPSCICQPGDRVRGRIEYRFSV